MDTHTADAGGHWLDELDRSVAKVAECARVIAKAQASLFEAVVELAGPLDSPLTLPGGCNDPAAEIVATELRMSATAAAALVHQARALTGVAAPTLSRLKQAKFSLAVALAISEGIEDLEPEVAEAVQQRVLARAERQTPAQVRRAVARARAKLAPEGEAKRARRALQSRRVELVPLPNGLGLVMAYLSAAEAVKLFGLLDGRARSAREAEREQVRNGDLPREQATPIGVLRADALVQLVGLVESWVPGPLTSPPTGGGAVATRLPCACDGPRVGVAATVVLDLATALGLADNPGELLGYGPLPGDVVRDLAADATWRAAFTDSGSDSRSLLALGRTTYTPSASLRRFIQARDRRCRFPGCGQPARRCDIDHAVPWADGGITDPGNLGALCRRHHRLKTAGVWQISESRGDGSCTWTSPTGRTYEHEPDPVLPF